MLYDCTLMEKKKIQRKTAKDTLTQVFSSEFAIFLRKSLIQNTFEQLLLKLQIKVISIFKYVFVFAEQTWHI